MHSTSVIIRIERKSDIFLLKNRKEMLDRTLMLFKLDRIRDLVIKKLSRHLGTHFELPVLNVLDYVEKSYRDSRTNHFVILDVACIFS